MKKPVKRTIGDIIGKPVQRTATTARIVARPKATTSTIAAPVRNKHTDYIMNKPPTRKRAQPKSLRDPMHALYPEDPTTHTSQRRLGVMSLRKRADSNGVWHIPGTNTGDVLCRSVVLRGLERFYGEQPRMNTFPSDVINKSRVCAKCIDKLHSVSNEARQRGGYPPSIKLHNGWV